MNPQQDKEFSNLKVNGIFVAERSTFGTLRANRAAIGSLIQGVGHDGALLTTFVHGPTDELVFQVTEADGTVKYARLPLSMGPPIFGSSSFADPCVRTLSVVTEPTALAKLLAIRPIKGINYQPSPSDYTGLPAPPAYFDSDFYNSDFEGLWGDTLVPGGGSPCGVSKARNDLKRFHEDLDLNFVRFFNLNQEAQRDHIPFLNACEKNQISVILPLDFWTQQVDGTNWPSPFQDLVIDLITTLGPHPAVVAWQLGNELNGSVNAGKIATIFDLLVKHDVNKKPVTSALQLGFFPSFASEIKDAILAKGLETDYTNRFFQSVNIYPPQGSVVADALVNLQLIVNTTWPTSEFSNQPMLVSEYGIAENVGDPQDQADSIAAQAKWIKNVDNKKFLGACLFEFSNELWKGISQDDLGIVEFPVVLDFCTAEEPSNSTIYRVDKLEEKPLIYDAFKAVVNP